MKRFGLLLLVIVMVLLAMTTLFTGCTDENANPCDESCERHSDSGECHCHGQCGTEGCKCHSAH